MLCPPLGVIVAFECISIWHFNHIQVGAQTDSKPQSKLNHFSNLQLNLRFTHTAQPMHQQSSFQLRF